jgi:hypothetical protein
MIMCSSGLGQCNCEFCRGEGSNKKAQTVGQVKSYETVVCGVCGGTGKCPNCVPDETAVIPRKEMLCSA